MAEESGGVVASQASVVIGADWSGVESAFTAVNRLEAKIKSFNPNIPELKLKMPDTKSFTAKINAEIQAGLSKPFTVNVAAKLASDSFASIQSQLNSQIFTIRVKPEVVGGAGVAGAPVSGNIASTYSTPVPPRFSTGYRAPSYGSWTQDQQHQEEFSGAYSQQMMQQQQASMRFGTSNSPAFRSGIGNLSGTLHNMAMERAQMQREAERAAYLANLRASMPAGFGMPLTQGHRYDLSNGAYSAQQGFAFNSSASARSLAGDVSMRGYTMQEQSQMRGYGAGYNALPAVMNPLASYQRSEQEAIKSNMITRARLEDNRAALAAAPLRSSILSQEAANAATAANLTQLRNWGQSMSLNPAIQNMTEAEASAIGAGSRLPWQGAMAATVARNDLTGFARRNFNPSNLGQGLLNRFSMTEAQQMKLQQDARRSYFAGQTLTRTVTMPALLIGGAMAYQGAKFDSQFGKIGALTDTDNGLLSGLKQQTIDLSMGRGLRSPINQSASQVADTLYEVASAGYTGSAGRRVSTASVEGATVGLGDSKVVADVVTDALAAYKLPPQEAREIVNKLLKGVIFGKGDAAAYAPAMPKVLSTAAIAGVGFDQVMASMATMSRIGIKPEAGATAMNQLLMHLVAPTPQGNKALAQLNWTPQSIKSDIRDKGLAWVSEQIIKRSDRVSGGDGTALQEQLLGNVRGWKGLMATAGVQPEAYKEALAKVQSGNDQLSESMKTMAGTVEVQWQRILNTISGTALKIEQNVMPTLTKKVEGFADALPNRIGKAGDVLDMMGTSGKTALGFGIGAAALAGPAFHMMAVGKDFRSFLANRPGSMTALGGVGAALSLPYAAGMANNYLGGPRLSDNQLALVQAGLIGATAYRPLRELAGGIESGAGRFAGNIAGLSSRTRDTYAAYAAARQAEGLGSSAMNFAPWLMRGGNVAGPTLSGVPLGQTGVFARLGGAPTFAGTMGAAGVATIGIGAVAGYDFYRQTQRELREREDARKTLYANGTIISKEFEKGDRFASASPEASQRLGDIATRFAGAATDAAQLRDRIKELNQLKIDINAGTIKMSPLAADHLKMSADKIIKQVQDQIKAVEVQVKIKGSWEGFKGDVGDLVTGQQPWQRTSAGVVTSFGGGLLDPLGISRYIGNAIVSGKGAGNALVRGLIDPTGIGNRLAPYFGAENGDALPFTPGNPTPRPTVNDKGQFVAPPSQYQIEHTIEGILGINIKDRSDMAGFINNASKAQIDKLQAALTGKDKKRLTAVLGEDFIGRIVARQTELSNAAPGNNTNSGGGPATPTPEQVQALEQQRRALESDAEAMNKRASAYGNFGSALDGIISRTRSFSDETEKSRLNNELHKRSLDGVDESMKRQALTVAGLNDRMKELAGTSKTLRGFNEGLEGAVSGVGGDLGGLRGIIGQEAGALGYSRRMTGLSRAGLGVAYSLGNVANARSLDYQQQARNLTAQAGAVGSDATAAEKARGKGEKFTSSIVDGLVEGAKTPANKMLCAEFAGTVLQNMGVPLKGSKGAMELVRQAKAAGAQEIPVSQASAGDLAFAYGKIYGVQKDRFGKGVHVGAFDADGHIVAKNKNFSGPASRWLGRPQDIRVLDTSSLIRSGTAPVVVHNTKGKPFVAKSAVGFERQQDEAPINDERFDGIDDSLSGRSMNLQWALGARIRPNQYNGQQFALQQFLEQKSVQLSFGNIARQLQIDPTGKKQLSDKEVQALAAMDSMSEAQLSKLMASRPAIVRKLVGLMKRSSVFADKQVNSFAGSQAFIADQKQRALGMFSARNPLDSIGLKRLQLSQDRSLSQAQRDDMLSGFIDIEKSGSWSEATNQQSTLDDQSAGYNAGRSYVLGNSNWSDAEVGIAAQLGEFRSGRDKYYNKRFSGKGMERFRTLRVQTDMRLESQRLRAPIKYQQFINNQSDMRDAWASSDDSTSLNYQLGLGRNSELANLEIQRDRFARNYQQSGRGTLGQGQILARVNYNTQLQNIENSNLDRYNQEVKSLERGMASLGDTTGNVARAFDLWDEKLGRGLTNAQRFNVLSKSLEAQQQQRDFQLGMDAAPLFYGRSGARNQTETLQSQLDQLKSSRDSRLAAAIKANPNMTVGDIASTFDAQEKELQDKIDASRRNDPRAMRNESINRFEAGQNRLQEELAATKAISDADKERLYVLKEENRYKEAGIKFDDEARALAEEQAKQQTAITKQLEQATRMRGMVDRFQGVSGRAFDNLLTNNGADREARRQQRLGEEYRWGDQMMDLYDRGYGSDSSEFKNAQKRHKQLMREGRGKGRIGEFLSDTFGGFGDEARRTSASAVNDALWGKIGPALGNVLLPSSKKKSGAGGIFGSVLESITGIAGPLGGAAGSGTEGHVANMTLQAQNVYVNGQNTGPGSIGLNMGGGNSFDQIMQKLGVQIRKSSR